VAVLAVEITLPHAPITSLQKRMVKGVEQIYYAKLFLSNPAYDQASTWRGWLDQGFHVATYSPPPAASSADRVRVRVKAPSPKPVFSLEGTNTDALKDLDALLQAIDATRPALAGGGEQARNKALHDGEVNRLLTAPLAETLERYGFTGNEIDAYHTMLERGFNALTDDNIQSIEATLT
jgi:hypothetical protein